MYQYEIKCEECDSHFIVATKQDQEPLFCPFCKTSLGDSVEAEDIEEEE